MENKFNSSSALTAGWQKFKEYPWVWIGMALFIVLPSIISEILFSDNDGDVAQAVVEFVFAIVPYIFTLGIIQAALQAFENGRKPVIKDLVSVVDNRLLSAILAYVFTMLLMIIPIGLLAFGIGAINGGFVAPASSAGVTVGAILIFGGIVLAIAVPLRLLFVQHYIIDRSQSAIEAIKSSYYSTRDHFWFLLLFFVLICLLNIVGVLFIGVGLLVSVPVTLLATTFVYRQISGQASPGSPSEAPIDQVDENYTDVAAESDTESQDTNIVE